MISKHVTFENISDPHIKTNQLCCSKIYIVYLVYTAPQFCPHFLPYVTHPAFAFLKLRQYNRAQNIELPITDEMVALSNLMAPLFVL